MINFWKAVKIGYAVLSCITSERIEEVQTQSSEFLTTIKDSRKEDSESGKNISVNEAQKIVAEGYDIIEAIIPGYKEIKAIVDGATEE